MIENTPARVVMQDRAMRAGHGADALTRMPMQDGLDFAIARARIDAIRNAGP
jgi:hypothetical protein